MCVAHNDFAGIDAREFLADRDKGVVYDVKGILPREQVDARL